LFYFFAWPQPGQAGTKKELACPGNYKIQITNYKQRGALVKHGQILYAFGEEHKMVSFIKPDRVVCNFGHCNLEFVCILSYGPCPFFEQGHCNFKNSAIFWQDINLR
jgi:hypothetical protein